MSFHRGEFRRIARIVAAGAVVALSAFAQSSPFWRTAGDIREGVSGSIVGTVQSIEDDGFTLVTDSDAEDAADAVRVVASAGTRYRGLGPDAATSVVGAPGLAELRVGDRVDVRGVGQAGPAIRASEVRLIGRSVAPLTGATTAGEAVEGIVREIRLPDQSFVLETEEGTRLTIVGTEQTSVLFEGRTYSIRNLEEGDRVRVEIDARLSSGELRAGRIEVLEDSTPDAIAGIRSENLLTGRVVRIEPRANRFTLRADRAGEIRVDASRAVDRTGNPFRVGDLQIGDRLRIRGEYVRPDVFRAERIEFGTAEDAVSDEFRDRGQEPFEGFSTVVFYGSVERNPPNEDRLVIRDRDSRRELEIVVDEEFVVQQNGAVLRAGQLRRGDQVVVKAFRDARGNYIAQTIRVQP